MKKRKKRVKKKNLSKRKVKSNNKKNRQNQSIDLQKVLNFNFKTLNKAYESFITKRKKEKVKQPLEKIEKTPITKKKKKRKKKKKNKNKK